MQFITLYIYMAFLGAVVNKIRGGILTDIFNREIPFNKVFNDIAYAVVFTYLITGFESWRSALAYASLHLTMFAGRSVGWGNYIGGMMEKKIYPQPEVKWIDKLVIRDDGHPVLRNCIALSLRGLMWTVPLAVGFLGCKLLGYYIADSFFWIAPLGLLMGPTYLFTIKVTDAGWGYGEILWGFILWGSMIWLVY